MSGLLYGCVVVGFAAIVVMRLFPLYNEKFKVDAALEHVTGQPSIGSQSGTDITKLLLKDFEVSDMDRFDTAQALGKVMKIETLANGAGRRLRMAYEIRGPLFGPLDIILKYERQIEFAGSENY
ncbi:MAG: DUF4845 domain-containing protein [Gammaproteobacteria bacterium]|nr:DUF4845 domain-containing protein [Gammaproteobacteria bacterium]